jgi:hypothetical protein
MAELRKYGAAATVYFPLVDAGAVDFEATPVTFASGDTQISKDGGAFANCTNDPAHEGNGIYSLVLTATEMEAAVVVVTVIDSATKAWEDQAIIIDTYGNASAQHAFDLDTASSAQTGDSYARLGAPAGASIAADIATVDGVADDILTDTGTTLPGTLSTIEGKIDTVDGNVDSILVDTDTTLPGTLSTIEGKIDTVDGNVDSILVDTDTTLPGTLSTIEGKIDTVDGNVDSILVDTDTTIPGLIAALNDLSAAEVNAEVDTALTDIHLDHLLAADYDPASKPGTATALLNELVESDSGVSRFTENALEQAPGGVGSGMDLDDTLEGSITVGDAFRIVLAVLAGKSTGGGSSSLAFRDVADTKDRVVATVDSDGNRTGVTRDGS